MKSLRRTFPSDSRENGYELSILDGPVHHHQWLLITQPGRKGVYVRAEWIGQLMVDLGEMRNEMPLENAHSQSKPEFDADRPF